MPGKVYYNKLIRDGIADKIRGKGEECEVRTIEDSQEYEQELLKKVAEEAGALSRVRTKDAFLDEYADLNAVLTALKEVLGVTEEEVHRACEGNMQKKGGFTKRLFLHWSSDGQYQSNETPQGVNH